MARKRNGEELDRRWGGDGETERRWERDQEELVRRRGGVGEMSRLRQSVCMVWMHTRFVVHLSASPTNHLQELLHRKQARKESHTLFRSLANTPTLRVAPCPVASPPTSGNEARGP